MLLLDEAGLERLKQRCHTKGFQPGWQQLVGQAKPLITQRPPVPPAGIANWAHYYFCSEHHAPLEFNPTDPHHIRCSFGCELLTEKIYYETWWRKVNILLADACLAGAVLAVSDYQPDLSASYIQGVAKILLDYAAVYPGYAVHGDIPYNGPGKANAQTLDEATWIMPLVTAYDLVRSRLQAEDCLKIERDLFATCADFLVEYSEKQLHNHQCWISAAVAAIGLLLEREDFVKIGLHQPWGLLEQLKQGVLGDGSWLEGAAGYHFYAFEAFTSYARLAYHTSFALHNHPILKKMPKAILYNLLPDHTFPLFNDTVPPKTLANSVQNYELAASWHGEPEYLWVLHQVYNEQQHPRTSLNALLYGLDEIKAVPSPSMFSEDYSSSESGITLFRKSARRANLAYVALKHSPFGGEHDHMDRLNLSFGSVERPRLAADLGTVPYSLPLHYGYFKTTVTNNTVWLANQNQPPADARLVELQHTEHYSLINSRCDWAKELGYPYGGVIFRRAVLVAEGYVLDIFVVNAPTKTPMEYAWHWQGKLNPSSTALFQPIELEATNLMKAWFTDVVATDGSKTLVTTWLDETTGAASWQLWSAGAVGQHFRVARAPDNPLVRRDTISYWLVKSEAETHCYVHLFKSLQSKNVEDLVVEQFTDVLTVKVFYKNTVTKWNINNIMSCRKDLKIWQEV